MFRWIDHTAELELEIEAPTEAAVFADALAAFAELADGGGGVPLDEEIRVQAPDPEMRLVAWLEELIYLGETAGFVPERVESLDLEGDSLHARISGHTGSPSPLVKAVTLHRLELGPDESGTWWGRVVLDV